mmetsp:Transcript_26310/g.40369  ORF Transcript_26310/g.40369 Transcript_26310/m.40369 type:complete len:105 (+) Transcript_26310:212-526(+)
MILRLFCAVASLNMAQAFMPMFASSSSSTHRQQKQIVLQVGDSYMQYINGRNSLKYFKNRTMFEEQEMELTVRGPNNGYTHMHNCFAKCFFVVVNFEIHSLKNL